MKIERILYELMKNANRDTSFYDTKDGFLYFTFDGHRIFRIECDGEPIGYKKTSLATFFDVDATRTEPTGKMKHPHDANRILRTFGDKKIQNRYLHGFTDRHTAYYSAKGSERTSPLLLMDDVKGDGSGEMFCMILPVNVY